MNNKIINGNNIELLKQFPDNHFDSIVTDPFCGSGTTGVACKLEEFDFVGLEQDAEYCKIAQARIDNYVEEEELKIIEKIEGQLSLF